jgi:hypothetical protein
MRPMFKDDPLFGRVDRGEDRLHSPRYSAWHAMYPRVDGKERRLAYCGQLLGVHPKGTAEYQKERPEEHLCRACRSIAGL